MLLDRSDDMRTHKILTRMYKMIVSPGDDLANIITPDDGMYLDGLEWRIMQTDVTLLTAGNFHIYTDVVGKYILIKEMQNKIIEAIGNIEGWDKK